MSDASLSELIEMAAGSLNPHRVGDRLFGDVAAMLITDRGSVFCGVCIDTGSGTGFCAEHAAIAAMVTAGEYHISRIVAVSRDDRGALYVVPPCGRCREFIRQVDPSNLDTEVILGRTMSPPLRDLLPLHEWPQPLSRDDQGESPQRPSATTLRAMTTGELDSFLDKLRTSLVHDLTAAGHDERDAAKMADGQLTATFPDGQSPAGHHVCHIVRDGREAGHVWYGPDPAGADGAWWLFDIEMSDRHRGKGIGTDSMAQVEDRIRRLGGTSMALRVFDHNSTARSVYERSGYHAVSTLMRKVL